MERFPGVHMRSALRGELDMALSSTCSHDGEVVCRTIVADRQTHKSAGRLQA
jgi:hypothetical protein